MPSVSDLIFLTLLFGLSCGALGRLLLRDAGTGWHIRNGQLMLAAHTITRVDPFSATFAGKPWYAWEWLYDALIAIVHQTLGLNGVVYYSAAIIAASFVVTLYFSMKRGANLLAGLFFLLLSIAASAVHFLARPHVLSWLLAVIWFDILDSAALVPTPMNNRRLYWLPILMLFWVNVHGAFLLGFALLAIYLAGTTVNLWKEPGRRMESTAVLKHLAWTTALCAAASFVNPFGYKLHIHIYQYLSDRYLMNRISEFASPNFHGAAQQCFAALLLIAIVVLASVGSKLHAARILVVLFAVFSGLYATRNLPSASLLLTLVLAPALSEAMARAASGDEVVGPVRRICSRINSFGARMRDFELLLTGHVWLVVGFLVGLWACAHGGRFGSTQLISAYFEPKRFPVEATAAIINLDIRDPIFSLDHWGGYLIYELYPQNRVFVDDRHDFYGDAYIQDYLEVVLVQPGWEKVLDDNHVDWVLMPRWSSLANFLSLRPEWMVEHEDETAILFHRKSE